MKEVPRLKDQDRLTEKMSRTKNKRKRENEQPLGVASSPAQRLKRAKKSKGGDRISDTRKSLSHPLLSQLYPHVETLRDYVLARLPASSRLRRKKIGSVGLASEASEKAVMEIEQDVARLLDTTVVAYSEPPEAQHDDRWEKWNSFSQNGDESYVTLSDGFAGASFSQAEVIESFNVIVTALNVLTPL